MEHPRTTSARAHDDSERIESAIPAPSHGGREGGDLARDIATEAEEERIEDPEAHVRVTKEKEREHGTRRDDRAR